MSRFLKALNTIAKRHSGFEGAVSKWDMEKFISDINESRLLKALGGKIEVYNIGHVDVLIRSDYQGDFITNHEPWNGVKVMESEAIFSLEEKSDGTYIIIPRRF